MNNALKELPYPMEALPQPRRWGRRGWLAVGAAAAVAAGALAYAYGGGAQGPSGYRFEAPDHFQGLTRAPEDRTPGTGLVMAAGPGDFTVLYTDEEAPDRIVLVMGHAQPFADPSARLDAQVEGSPWAYSDLRRVDPGPFGGAMSCGAYNPSAVGAPQYGLCIWYDAGMTVTYGESVHRRAPDLRTLEEHARSLRELAEKPG
ncbi:hypothetical protein [Kitasatospora sp. NPDC094015]|uniref:hypothetical protein n=1 Tax=Kitasatospora sp. NPDC094015 TaxID=3155205 RepID=UPI00331D0DC7